MVIRTCLFKVTIIRPRQQAATPSIRGGAVSLPSNAERLVVEWRASSPSKIEGVAAEQTGAYESNFIIRRMKVTMTDRGV